MSFSYRTEPIRRQAWTRVRRTREGAVIYPRVIQRAPRSGDIYALNKSAIVAMYPYIRMAYLNGLSQIELRARVSPEVGDPYGSYVPGEASIRLYSTPRDLWIFRDTSVRWHWRPARYGARLEQVGADVHVHWSSVSDLARFLFVNVLAHELGHHFDFRYKHKRKLPGTRRAKEQSADGHIPRLEAESVFYTANSYGLLRFKD
jgi:hypothetical protein